MIARIDERLQQAEPLLMRNEQFKLLQENRQSILETVITETLNDKQSEGKTAICKQFDIEIVPNSNAELALLALEKWRLARRGSQQLPPPHRLIAHFIPCRNRQPAEHRN